MKDRETRRTSPLAKITLALVVVVVFLEAFVIFGGLELRAQTVEKYAPWAYEPFLKLVGEHPGSKPRWLAEQEASAEEPAVANVAGLAPEAIPQLLETNAPAATNQLIEPTVPQETEAVPVLPPTNSPAAAEEEVVPVG